MTYGKALGIIVAAWIYAILTTSGPFIGWGAYTLGWLMNISKCAYKNIIALILILLLAEGMLISCSYDYLTETANAQSFVVYGYMFNYFIPVSTCIFFYSQIVMAVVKHERALREQAKKMNVDSLRQGNEVRNVRALNTSG